MHRRKRSTAVRPMRVHSRDSSICYDLIANGVGGTGRCFESHLSRQSRRLRSRRTSRQTNPGSPSVWREAVLAGEEVGATEVSRIVLAERDGLVHRIKLAESEQRRAAGNGAQNRLGSGESDLAVYPDRCTGDCRRRPRLELRGHLGSSLSQRFSSRRRSRTGDLDLDQALELLRSVAAVIGVRSDVSLALEQELRRRTT